MTIRGEMVNERGAVASHGPSTDAPLRCTIRSEGELDSVWSERLGGLALRVCRASGRPVTELSGVLPDQAALMGVLVTLYNLGLPLLAVSSRTIAGRGTGHESAPAAGCTETAAPAARRRA
jgi:hypothetical protein